MSEYLSLEEASDLLGRGYSKRSIIRRIDNGEWKEGIHWIDDRRSGSKYRLIKINLEEVEKWRKRPAAKR